MKDDDISWSEYLKMRNKIAKDCDNFGKKMIAYEKHKASMVIQQREKYNKLSPEEKEQLLIRKKFLYQKKKTEKNELKQKDYELEIARGIRASFNNDNNPFGKKSDFIKTPEINILENKVVDITKEEIIVPVKFTDHSHLFL